MKELNEKTFSELKGTVVVDFWAPWCGPCKLMGPVFEQVSKEITGITFAKINVDESQELASAQGVTSIPAIVIYKDKEEVDRRTGYMPAGELKNWLKSYGS